LNNPDSYCPVAAGMDIDELVAGIQADTLRVASGTELVHDGYLCTMIVKAY